MKNKQKTADEKYREQSDVIWKKNGKKITAIRDEIDRLSRSIKTDNQGCLVDGQQNIIDAIAELRNDIDALFLG